MAAKHVSRSATYQESKPPKPAVWWGGGRGGMKSHVSIGRTNRKASGRVLPDSAARRVDE